MARRLLLIPVLMLIVGVGTQAQDPVCEIEPTIAPGYEAAVRVARPLAQQFQEAFGAPGMAIAVGIGREIVWSEQFGYADVETERPVCADTLFRVGSVSKPLTSAGIGVLVDEGALDLDAPIQTYVPDFPTHDTPITVRLLSGHLAGIRHYRGDSEVYSRQHYDSVHDSLALFQDDPLLFEPGTRYEYSSFGWNLIGAAIEGASGTDFGTFMHDHVFEPLDMTHTLLDDSTQTIPNRATDYDRVGRGDAAPSRTVDLSNRWPSGGFLSTAEDLVRFGGGLLCGDLLSQETVDLLWTPQTTSDGEETAYGMGWEVIPGDSFGWSRVVLHTGAVVGGSSLILIIPDQQLTLAITMNVGLIAYNGDVPAPPPPALALPFIPGTLTGGCDSP